MSSKPTWVNGSWNVVCDVCGREYKAEELRQRWDGLLVCLGDWEPRQPQDFVKAIADKIAPPWTRPEPADTFINPYVTSVSNHQINGAAINTLEID